ncbi:MAG: SPOR domain-containing protein [Acidisphaera sp.]|nr:SPOR domain-containing protein [Acidisphaera sp.]
MKAAAASLLAGLLTLGSCGRSPPPPAASIRYTLGAPYQAAGVWHYPRADFFYNMTGLASVAPSARKGLTADGERYDATAMAAGHPTLQLPAIARLTNLATGLSALVRLNDRGPAAPTRLVEVTPRVAQLLQIEDGSAVRLQVQEGPSRQAVADLPDSTPKLVLATAPAGAVAAEALAPPSGVTASARTRTAAALPTANASVAVGTAAAVPLRLPEQVERGPSYGAAPLYVVVGSFSRPQYARLLQARLAGLGAQIASDYSAPADRAIIVRLGPFASAAEADAALNRAVQSGVSEAAIVVGP